MTADITVLQTTYNDQLKELCRVTGDDCGGTSVDDRFFKMLDEIAGGKVISELKEKDPLSYTDLVREFEAVKRTVRTEKKTKVSSICFDRQKMPGIWREEFTIRYCFVVICERNNSN